MFKNFIDQTINGLQTGSIYALIALGYTMVYGIVKLINFAHGDILMIGAYISFMAVNRGFGLTTALIISIIFCSILGIVMERLAYRPLRDASRMNVLITAIGLSFLLESLALIYFGASPKIIKSEFIPKYLSSSEYISIFGIRVSNLSFFVIIVTLFCMLLLHVFI
ncbi:branched-chain amino acid ABC transporter permease, partial [Streptobacillus moniliformis]